MSFASILGLSNAQAQNDPKNYCEAITSVIPDAIKARESGMSEADFLATQGANAEDDIEKTLVHLAYTWPDMPDDLLRQNAINACVHTNGWANCTLEPKTGLECVPAS